MSSHRAPFAYIRPMRPATALTIARAELRGSLRDRSLVSSFVMVPLLMYPVIFWLMITVMMLVEARSGEVSTRAAVDPAVGEAFSAVLASDPGIEVDLVDRAAAERLLVSGAVDAAVLSTDSGGYPVEILFDGSRDRSALAADRLSDILERTRRRLFERYRASLGISPSAWTVFRTRFHDTSSDEEMGGFVLGLILPATITVMISIGCFHQAVDSMAGEKERRTWETLISTSVTRPEIVAGKFLSVFGAGMTSGILNIGSMILTLSFVLAPLIRQSGESISIGVPVDRLPALVTGAVTMAAALASGMLAFASLARTFKEGQAMVTPFYMLVVAPIMFVQLPGMTFAGSMSAVPVMGSALLIKASLLGEVPFTNVVILLASTTAFCALMLWIAGRIVSSESASFREAGWSLRSVLGILRGGDRRV